MGVNATINGSNKQIKSCMATVGGVWKKLKKGWVTKGGVWQPVVKGVKLITFTTSNYWNATWTAEEGMTWAQFVDSSYNPTMAGYRFTIINGEVRFGMPGYEVFYNDRNGNVVLQTDVIIEGQNYYIYD